MSSSASSYAVFQFDVPGPEPMPGLVSILPRIGIEQNILQALQDITSSQLMHMACPNFQGAASGWAVLSGNIGSNILTKTTGYSMKSHIPEVAGYKTWMMGTTPLGKGR